VPDAPPVDEATQMFGERGRPHSVQD
jgi:hypothetical protein